MIMWCTILVTVMHFQSETAAKGKVLHETGSSYVLDFSEYAKSKGYEGDFSEVTVDKDKCLKEEKPLTNK